MQETLTMRMWLACAGYAVEASVAASFVNHCRQCTYVHTLLHVDWQVQKMQLGMLAQHQGLIESNRFPRHKDTTMLRSHDTVTLHW